MNAASRAIAVAMLMGVGLILTSQTQAQQQATVPDAPTPRGTDKLPVEPVTPGIGAGGSRPSGPQSSSSTAGIPQLEEPQATPAPDRAPVAASEGQSQGQSATPQSSSEALATFRVRVNFVEVPVMVKDSAGKQVAGLTWRDFTVYENNTRQRLTFFSVDPQPLSIAFVVDQTLPGNIMAQVNQSLGSFQGALTPFDEAAIFTYANGVKRWTTFTGGQGAALPTVLALARAPGTNSMAPITGGNPLSGACSISVNGSCPDPNLQPGKSTQMVGVLDLPKEIHTLNDAILAAATELSTCPKGQRRVLYVISDGKEFGSKARWRDVVQYLQTNRIAVVATLVGDSARWGEGWLDRFHLPFSSMYDNVLYKYTTATGGELFAEGGVNGIEDSYRRIAVEARNEYTLGYASQHPIYDEHYRSIDVRVNRPGLVVTAKPGYYPSGQDYK